MGTRRNRLVAAASATSLLAAGLVLTSAASTAPLAHAGSVIQVTTTQQKIGGPGGCSLEEAILAANHDSSSFTAPGNDAVVIQSACLAGDGADVIELPPNAVFTMDRVSDDAYNYMGPTATPVITSDIVIEGQGASIVHLGTDPFRAFAVGVSENSSGDVVSRGALELREVDIKGFTAKGGDGAGGGGGGLGAGGAIFVNEGSLRVRGSTLESNRAEGGNGAGGNTTGAGGGGGGLGGRGGSPSDDPNGPGDDGGGGGGARGAGADGGFAGGGGGGTIHGGDPGGTRGGYRCGGDGGEIGDSSFLDLDADGDDGRCRGGGGGGGESEDLSPGGSVLTSPGDGGDGNYGGGGGGGGYPEGDGGDGGEIGGGGGAGPAFHYPDGWAGGGGGDGGFGGGGGAGPGGVILGEPGEGGTFGGDAGDLAGGGGAALGGAIFGHEAIVEITNSTFFGNSVAHGLAGGDGARNGADAGGALFLVGGLLRVTNSTILGNQSTGDGGGIVVYDPEGDVSARLELFNTIVAHNIASDGHHDECFLLGGASGGGSNNLVMPHDNDNRTPCPGIMLTSDPLLGPLTLNAPGRTPTMAPDPSSPVVDAGNPNVAPFDDQRLIARPQGGGIDIGAYEYDGPPMPTDFTAPAASPTQVPPANSAQWNNTNVTVSWNWADNANGSGVNPAACTTTSTTSGEGSSVAASASCADHAGNVGSASYTAHIDLTAPTVACAAAPAYVLNGAPTIAVTATVSDSLSGPVATTIGAVPTAGDVATAGVHAMQLTGADQAGNSTTVACTYLVAYRFDGFLEPIPQSAYKRGSTVPIKFRLTNANGTPISDAAAQALLTPVCSVRVSFDGVDAGCVRYIASTDTFQLDLKLSKTMVAGLHAVGVTVTAGSVILNSSATTVVIRR